MKISLASVPATYDLHLEGMTEKEFHVLRSMIGRSTATGTQKFFADENIPYGSPQELIRIQDFFWIQVNNQFREQRDNRKPAENL